MATNSMSGGQTTPPPLSGPSAKEKKYDRQLRLWAAAGQDALESSRILLVNAGSGCVGIETLKNLVLPGIGHFSIWDTAQVQEADLGVNFFLEEQSLGSSRAQQCARFLQELNPHVRGDWFPKVKDQPFQSFLGTSDPFSVVIYSEPLPKAEAASLVTYARSKQIPLITVHSCGFYSYFRVGLFGNLPLIDSHNESNTASDLRLMEPWPELFDFATATTRDIDSMPDHEHGHIPYICLILHFLQIWKASKGAYPSSYKDKVAFRSLMAANARTDTAGGEENFDEAAGAVLKSLRPASIPDAVKRVFAYEPSDTEATTTFWRITGGLKQFYNKHGVLPLSGVLPDMKSVSKTYLQLQRIYKAKAKLDAEEVFTILQTLGTCDDLSLPQVEVFCKNAAALKLIYGTDHAPADIQALATQERANDEVAVVASTPQSLLPIYLALHSVSQADQAATVPYILSAVQMVATDTNLPILTDIAKEVLRARAGELHNTAAITGGMVAQEIIKVITRQYVPIDNTCVFDGITSRTQVLRT